MILRDEAQRSFVVCTLSDVNNIVYFHTVQKKGNCSDHQVLWVGRSKRQKPMVLDNMSFWYKTPKKKNIEKLLFYVYLKS